MITTNFLGIRIFRKFTVFARIVKSIRHKMVNLSYVIGEPVLWHMQTTKKQISLHSLISIFVVRSLDSIISVETTLKISRPELASDAEQVFQSYLVANHQRQVFSWCGSCDDWWVTSRVSSSNGGYSLILVDFCLNIEENTWKYIRKILVGKK